MKKLILFLSVSLTLTAKGQFNIQDSLALVDLYWSTNGPSWNNNTNWLTGPVPSWRGIYTDVTDNDRVVAIKLQNNNLTGSLPLSIGSLTRLNLLELYNNKISGTLPYTIGRMHTVIYIYIYI